MTAREALHQLIDELAENELGRIEQLIQAVRDGADDPLLRALLLAPWDDEPETDEERAAIQEGLDDLARGKVVSHEELRRELGW